MEILRFLLAAALAAQMAWAITGQVGAYVVAASPSPTGASGGLTPSPIPSPTASSATPAPVTGLAAAEELSKTIFDWLTGMASAVDSALNSLRGLKVF
ncbi:MAG TPA: hypothetical protein VI875_04135 [Candidatus Norongarragalinales archaeon]|nr:hypothetical protein [Candidatus Norongarragalinales archaeon]